MDKRYHKKHDKFIIHPFLDKIYINPELISQGAVSRVHASRCGQYIIKIPHNQLETLSGKSRWYQYFYHRNENTSSEFHYNQLCSPKSRHFSLALIKQAERLNELGHIYKVQSFGLGHYPEENIEALLIEKYAAEPISKLPLGNWYKYLPSILYALCDAPHGNLSPDNILIDSTTGEARLIDPGTMILDKNFTTYEETDYTCSYSANARYYPLIPPSFFCNRKIDLSNPYSALKLLYIPNPVETEANDCHDNPDIADILALGLMLYHKATGTWLFKRFRKDPLWVYDYSSVKRKYNFPNAVDLSDRVAGKDNYIAEPYNNYLIHLLHDIPEPQSLNLALPDKENDLIMALLKCETTFEIIMEMLMEINR
jgi:serine/threonine protein kinase